uniref:Cytochrome P450 monooxigenase n=1 Tax=Penicillium lilacinoechinulatum TaxID=451136 RepID=A9Q1F2_9EURO|nr:cytochrome P450 monooxigenase [Penicillium lilacinoechinulatum]
MAHPITLIICLALALVVSRPVLHWVVSTLVDVFLRWKHPLLSRPGTRRLPHASFSWPNGQGTEKFFQGRSVAREWRQRWGPIYQIWSGWTPEIVLTTPAHAAQFYRTSHRHTKASNNNSGWLFGEVLGVCVGLLSGSDWRRVRQYVEEPFSRPSAGRYTERFIDQARAYIQNDLQVAADCLTEVSGGISFEPARALQFFPFFTMAEILFGPLSSSQREVLVGLAPLREGLFKEVIRGGVNRLSIAPYLPWSGVRLLNTFQKQWRIFVEDAYAAALQAEKTPLPPVVGLWDAWKAGTITERECLQTLDESLYANLDVTTHAISWNVLLLAQNPLAQTQLREEVMQALSDTAAEPYEHYIDSEDTFLAACVVESARLRPILPFSNPESAPEDQYVDGYLIPKNTNVIVDSQAINIDNPFWVDGTKYDPTRYKKLKRAEVRYNLWRFGFGPRQCLGKNVAERMMRALTAEMVRQYVLSVPKNESSHDTLQEESWVGLPSIRMECVPIV